MSAEWAAAEDWKTYEARMLTGKPLVHSLPEVQERIRTYCSKYRKAELFAQGLAVGATLAPVNTVADVLAFEHLALRDYWDRYALPDGRVLRAPGPFVRASRRPIAFRRPAPAIGEHTRELEGAPRVQERLVERRGPSSLPFESVKIADFSWIGVGPITAKYFADHGATVVRVETEHPADRLRLVGPFKDNVPGVNRCQFFASFNTSKMSLALNLKRPEGIEVAKRLMRWADVCLDSFTAGTMAELGLGYEVARELNPSIVMASTCLLGQTGPAARLAGYGYHAAAICGFYEITGWDDRPPAGPFNAYTDTIAPRFSPLRSWRRSTTAGVREKVSTSTRPRWSRRCTSSRPSCSTISWGGACRGEPATSRRPPRRTTRILARVKTSGARSRSKAMSNGERCVRRWVIPNGRQRLRSPTRPGDARGGRRSEPSSPSSPADMSRAR